MRTYDKLPLTFKKQIELFRQRKLAIPDPARTERHLANISYYRLSAYMLPYKKSKEGCILDEFREGTTWDMIYDLYVFDRKLRLLVFDAIERLEIAVRTQIIYQLSHKYGSHWQDRADIFNPPAEVTLRNGNRVMVDVYGDIQRHIKEQLRNNKAEVFIQHYRNTYDNPENPPSWMSVEVMYFNHLSRICSGLKKRSDVADIAAYFDLPPETFRSWLHTINYVRNLCAHHARLWNREMSIIPERLNFSKHLQWISNPQTVRRSRSYYTFCILNYFLQTANPTSSFKTRLKALMDGYKELNMEASMGFPCNWKEENIWE